MLINDITLTHPGGRMLNVILRIFLLLILSVGIVTAQSSSNSYFKIDYLQVENDQQEQFFSFIENEVKPDVTNRLNEGEINYWKVYRVLFSGDRSYNYNYILKTSANSIDAFDYHNNSSIDLLSPSSVANKFSVQLSELWMVKISELRDEEKVESPYLMMDFMNVNLGRELEYQMLEDEVAKPLHVDRMEKDRMDGWEMYQLITPGGQDYGYNFSTGNFFNELAHIKFGFNEELIRSRNPDVNLMEFFDIVWSTRDLVKSEVWYLIDSVK